MVCLGKSCILEKYLVIQLVLASLSEFLCVCVRIIVKLSEKKMGCLRTYFSIFLGLEYF